MAVRVTKTQLAIELEKQVDALDRQARDMGHDPHPWSTDETHVTHSACRNCGMTMVVRITSSNTFKSGLPYKCKPTKRY
jgi:hypothetical protein